MMNSKSSITMPCYYAPLVLCFFLISSSSATRFVNIGETKAASSAADVGQILTFQTDTTANQNDIRPPTHGRNLLWGWSHWWPWNHHTFNKDTPPTGSDNLPDFESPAATDPGSDVGDFEDGDTVGGRGTVCDSTVQNVRTYYRGIRLIPPTNVGTATQCCRRCRQTSGCDYWAFCDKDSGCQTAGANSARLLKGQCELKKKEPEVLARGAGVDVISGRNAVSGGNRVSQTQNEVVESRQTEGQTTEELSGGQGDERGALFVNENTVIDENQRSNDAVGSGFEAVEALEELLDADP